MPTYQIRFIKGPMVAGETWYEADDDMEALSLFHLRGESTDCEIMCDNRRVAFIPKGERPVSSRR